MASFNNKVDILEEYDNFKTYHVYCETNNDSNPLIYMTILNYIAYHTFKNDSMIHYYSKIPTSMESNYLNPVYYINNIAHISATKINYCDASVWKGSSIHNYNKPLILLYFGEKPKEHDMNSLTIQCSIIDHDVFKTIVNVSIMDEGKLILLSKITLTMTINGITSEAQLIEEELDLQ